LWRVSLERRDLRADDIAVRVDNCGVCHTDLHAIHSARHPRPPGNGDAPSVPGHEFTGVVTDVGRDVTRFAYPVPLGG
jgi:uncharacterized zinc-type alcohol dehydrogenase-like protein